MIDQLDIPELFEIANDILANEPNKSEELVLKLNTSNMGSGTENWSNYSISGRPQFKTPFYVGRYEIGGENGLSISFSILNRPSVINRWFCKWCLGWKWIDNKK